MDFLKKIVYSGAKLSTDLYRVRQDFRRRANIELGRTDLQLSTLKKIFNALFCESLVIPKPLKELDSVIAAQAEAVAKKKVSRLAGTMMLEKQSPDKAAIETLIKAEKKKLINSPSSELWEE